MRIECSNCKKGYIIPDEKIIGRNIDALPCPNCNGRIKIDSQTSPTQSKLSLKSSAIKSTQQKKQSQPTTIEVQAVKKQQLTKKILQTVKDLPPMPQVILKAQEIMADSNSDVNKIARLIETEPSIATKVLKLSNSAYYGLSGKVTSIKHASVILGYKNLRQIISIASFSTFLGKRLPGYGFESDDFWKHCLAVALASKTIAEKKKANLENEAHAAGLIHDVGKVVLEPYVLKNKEKFDTFLENENETFVNAEKQIFGLDHAEFASEICKRWNIPQTITFSIKYHHSPSLSKGDYLSHILHVADYIAIKCGIGYDSDDVLYQLEDGTMDYLGIRTEEISDIMSVVIESMARLAE